MGKVILVLGVVVVLVLLVAGGSAFILMSPNLTKNAAPKPTENQLVPPTPEPTAPIAQPSTSAASNQIALTVSNPVNNSTVVTPNVQVKGQTVPNADVSVNEVDVKADANGAFTANLTLVEGDNPIVVTAIDAEGNASESEITVTYQAPGQ